MSLAQPPAVPAALPLGADGGDIFLSFRNSAGSDTTRFAKTFDPASFTGPSPALLAATILYTATDVADLVPGQDLWEYRYVVSGLTLTAGQGFTIFFAPNLYTLLETPPPFVNADWDALTVQPDVLLNSAGYYDALALRTNPSFADPFKLRFVWLGTGTPGAQPFTVYDTDFSTISQGQTTTIPEPSGLAHHNENTNGANSSASTNSGGRRRPIRSAAAPSSGAVSAAIRPPSIAKPAIMDCPFTASPTITVAT